MPQSKRYNLVLPDQVFNELQRIADERDVAVVDIIKQFIRLGFLVEKANKTSDCSVVIKHGKKEEGIYLL